MVRTVAKLRMLCNDIKIQGYEKQIPEKVYYRAIMENFGTEQYIVRDVSKSLKQLGFVRQLATGVLEFAGEFEVKEEKVAQKEEKVAQKEEKVEREDTTDLKTDEIGNVIE